MTRKRFAAVLLPIVMGLSAAACGDSPTEPTNTTTTATATAGTSTFASSFGPQGASSRLVTATAAGTLSVTLDSAGPPGDIILGLGVGIPRNDGGGCFVSTSLNTAAGAGARVAVSVDAGSYCVKVYDVGNARSTVSFSTTIVNP